MERNTRRAVAGGTIVASAELGVMSAGPWSWGLGCLLAVLMFVAGVSAWTQPEPARPFDHAVDC